MSAAGSDYYFQLEIVQIVVNIVYMYNNNTPTTMKKNGKPKINE